MHNFTPPNEPKSPQVSHTSEGWKSISSTLLIFILAPLTALFLTFFVFQSYQVDGPSMETTLQDNDRLIVNKLPRTWAKITRNQYVPDRADIIVFHRQSVAEFGGDKQLIKRVIGLPGERVVVKNGVVTIYNSENPHGFQPDKELSYGEVITTTQGNVDLVVGEDEVFVSGDNRANSLDSRSFGPIKIDDIVGKLAYRVYPFDKAQSF